MVPAGAKDRERQIREILTSVTNRPGWPLTKKKTSVPFKSWTQVTILFSPNGVLSA